MLEPHYHNSQASWSVSLWNSWSTQGKPLGKFERWLNGRSLQCTLRWLGENSRFLWRVLGRFGQIQGSPRYVGICVPNIEPCQLPSQKSRLGQATGDGRNEVLTTVYGFTMVSQCLSYHHSIPGCGQTSWILPVHSAGLFWIWPNPSWKWAQDSLEDMFPVSHGASRIYGCLVGPFLVP